jgi:hypothetical protein
MKDIIKTILLAPFFFYVFIADRITMRIFPFMFNAWHINTAMHRDRLWIAILFGYRLLTIIIFIATYYLIKYLIHAVF